MMMQQEEGGRVRSSLQRLYVWMSIGLRHCKRESHKAVTWNVRITVNASDTLLVPDAQVSMPNGAC